MDPRTPYFPYFSCAKQPGIFSSRSLEGGLVNPGTNVIIDFAGALTSQCPVSPFTFNVDTGAVVCGIAGVYSITVLIWFSSIDNPNAEIYIQLSSGLVIARQTISMPTPPSSAVIPITICRWFAAGDSITVIVSNKDTTFGNVLSVLTNSQINIAQVV